MQQTKLTIDDLSACMDESNRISQVFHSMLSPDKLQKVRERNFLGFKQAAAAALSSREKLFAKTKTLD